MNEGLDLILDCSPEEDENGKPTGKEEEREAAAMRRMINMIPIFRNHETKMQRFQMCSRGVRR